VTPENTLFTAPGRGGEGVKKLKTGYIIIMGYSKTFPHTLDFGPAGYKGQAVSHL
jgi:hypothetical protein